MWMPNIVELLKLLWCSFKARNWTDLSDATEMQRASSKASVESILSSYEFPSNQVQRNGGTKLLAAGPGERTDGRALSSSNARWSLTLWKGLRPHNLTYTPTNYSIGAKKGNLWCWRQVVMLQKETKKGDFRRNWRLSLVIENGAWLKYWYWLFPDKGPSIIDVTP